MPFLEMLKKVPGTKDILPPEVLCWQEIERLSRITFKCFNYQEIRLPILEFADLFSRSLGEFAEVVQKQMFLIRNQDELYALRPEATASLARAYVENNLDKKTGLVKFYYLGPMFRLERPQKGRLRQFHHLGCEAIGSDSPYLDVEIITLASRLLEIFGLREFKIKINSLGCNQDKRLFAQKLQEKLEDRKEELCLDCQNRLSRNVLRILDCKKEDCRRIVKGLNLNEQQLCLSCADAFKQVRASLDLLGLHYELDPFLVRGLDYYTRTVFEITHPLLGAQDALGAGGRYDNLIQELGGPRKPAVGFALGMERVIMAQEKPLVLPKENLVYIITLGKAAQDKGLLLLNQLRQEGICADIDYEGKTLKAALRKGNDLGARFCIIMGEEELSKGVLVVRDMAVSQQKEVQQDKLLTYLKDCLK